MSARRSLRPTPNRLAAEAAQMAREALAAQTSAEAQSPADVQASVETPTFAGAPGNDGPTSPLSSPSTPSSSGPDGLFTSVWRRVLLIWGQMTGLMRTLRRPRGLLRLRLLRLRHLRVLPNLRLLSRRLPASDSCAEPSPGRSGNVLFMKSSDNRQSGWRRRWALSVTPRF